ncbi:hypothetical protein V6N12_043218 [Hibiscus sabdariffa]|uniref:Uncharacterized protein n=1 Tax=Hibiscus sabdariffa TaxID=183260 RepID=A0ABR2DEQ3_9ROSI
MENPPISLERLAFPSPLEDQPTVKKNKNEGGKVVNLDVSAMDADIGDGQQRIVHDGDNVSEKPNSGVGKSVTYASVTAKPILDGSQQKPTAATIDEEVIILEEDVILNKNEKIPSIQFSNRVHDQVDRNMRNAIIVRLLGRTVGFKTLWTRTSSTEKGCDEHLNKDNGKSNGGTTNGSNAIGGSRFEVLQMEENEKGSQGANVGQGGKVPFQSVALTVQPNRGEHANRMDVSIDPVKNVAYLKSNPDKKTKKTIENRSVTVVSSLGAGNKDKRTRNPGFKTVLGTIGQNFKGRKSAETRMSDTRVVSEFITDLTDRLDSFQDHSSSLMEKDGDDNELGGSEEGFLDSDSRDNDDHDEDVILVEQ